MTALLRYLAGYFASSLAERVGRHEFAEDGIARVLVAPGLDPAGEETVKEMFPGAEVIRLDRRDGLRAARAAGAQAAVIPMTGGPLRPRLAALFSGARHKLLMPSADYVYRLGSRRGPAALFGLTVDRLLLWPVGLLRLALSALCMHATGLVKAALRAESAIAPRGVVLIRLAPRQVFQRLVEQVRERWPEAHLTAVIASPEGETDLSALAEVICSQEHSPLALIRQLRSLHPEAVILGGGADYVFKPTYWKAVVIARLTGAPIRLQWEAGEEAPGRPLRPAMRAALRRAWGRTWRTSIRPVVQIPARPWMRRRYHRMPTRGPWLVQIGISEACNYRCLMCPFHNPVVDLTHKESQMPRMSYEMFARLLADLKRMGTEAVDICGNGEPLTNPRAMDMIALARSMGFRVKLATNAALLTGSRARRLVDLGVERMHVSINAGTPETYPKMHPGTPPDAFDIIIERLRAMADYADATGQRRIDVEFSAVLTRLNKGELVQMVEAAHRARATWLMVILMGPVEEQPDLPPAPEDWPQIRRDLAEARKLAKELGLVTNLRELEVTATAAGTRSVYEKMPCYIGYEFALITGGGDVIFCCHCSEPLGNLHEEDFSVIWKSNRYQEARRQAMALPATKQSLPDCGCFFACSHVSQNLEVYERLHGKRGLRSLS